MTVNQKANRDLADYLHLRLERLGDCNAWVENKLDDDKMNSGVYTSNDPAIGKIIYRLEYVLGNTFRYTLLASVCSFLEEAIKKIAKRRLPDYDARTKAIKGGNWLHKGIQVLSSIGLDTASIQPHLDKFHDFITLRNCIVHAWGKLAEARDQAAVKAASKRLKTTEVSKDGYLVLGDKVVPWAIVTAENIAEHILIKLGGSMT